MASLNIAYFVTPHGFGHATRSRAIMEAVQKQDPSIRFEVFTMVPAWIFKDTPDGNIGYHQLQTDIGLIQPSSMVIDFEATLAALENYLPFDEKLVSQLARQLDDLQCRLVICDIAPLGIAVAQKCGVPSILVENFTWDWIYEPYHHQIKAFGKYIDLFASIYEAVDHRIQITPACLPKPECFTSNPVCRAPRATRVETRGQLGVAMDKCLVLITMGGIPDAVVFQGRLRKFPDINFLMPNHGGTMTATKNVTFLPKNSPFHHPDLIQASDVIIGKVGYSTLAEVFHAGIPWGYIKRPTFRESQVLCSFIEKEMPGIPIENEDYENGRWLDDLGELTALPAKKRSVQNGADQIAAHLNHLFSKVSSDFN